MCSLAFRKATSTSKSGQKLDRAARTIAANLKELEDPRARRKGQAVSACCRKWTVAVLLGDPSKSHPVPAQHCRERLCPRCQAVRARKWASKIGPLLEELSAAGAYPKMITLTQPARDGERLLHTRQRFEASLKRFYRDPIWKGKVDAWVCSREVTWNDGHWHYHAHLLVDADYWPQWELSRVWAACGGGPVVDIRAAHAGDEREVLKYALKVLTVPQNKLVELIDDLHGARLVSTGGAWRGRVKLEDLEPSDDEGPGWQRISIADLYSHVNDGKVWASQAIAACLVWLEERAGARGAQWLTNSILDLDAAEYMLS